MTSPFSPEEIKREFQRRKDRCARILGLAGIAMALPPVVEFYVRGANSLWPILLGLFVLVIALLWVPFLLRCPICGTIDPLTNHFSRWSRRTTCRHCDTQLR